MDIGLVAILGIAIAFIILIVMGSNYLEKLYYRKHPPDGDWDGCREDREEDEN